VGRKGRGSKQTFWGNQHGDQHEEREWVKQERKTRAEDGSREQDPPRDRTPLGCPGEVSIPTARALQISPVNPTLQARPLFPTNNHTHTHTHTHTRVSTVTGPVWTPRAAATGRGRAEGRRLELWQPCPLGSWCHRSSPFLWRLGPDVRPEGRAYRRNATILICCRKYSTDKLVHNCVYSWNAVSVAIECVLLFLFQVGFLLTGNILIPLIVHDFKKGNFFHFLLYFGTISS